ncbi:hypothetical protein JTB14_024729 [Gonioctena quinquepunctata]|nr:hypothetical protein JTB14_024729 [Gonioctena quinquepunctata]
MDIPKALQLLKNFSEFVKQYRAYSSASIIAKEIASQAEIDPIFKATRRKKRLFNYEAVDEPPTDPEELFKINVFYPMIDTIESALLSRARGQVEQRCRARQSSGQHFYNSNEHNTCYVKRNRLQCVCSAGRGTDFVGGIDNEALDFSQLEDFINSEGSQGNNSYFGESLNSASTSGKLLNVIVENKRNNNGHSLPESPPDSSSEHPYSPQDGCDAPITAQESIYTNLTQNMYKPTILSPILTDNLILGSHIVVTDQNSEQLLDNGNILQDNGLLVSGDIRTNTTILNNRSIQDNIQSDPTILQSRIIISEANSTDNNRPILLPSSDSPSNFDRNIFKNDEYEKNMVHMAYNHNIENLPRNNIENNMCEQNLDSMQGVYTNLQSAPKKRKLSQDSPLVKSEPEHCTTSQLSPSEQLNSSVDDDYASSEACLSESQYQCIRFNAFQQTNWHMLCDQNLTELPVPHYRVDADKGFNFQIPMMPLFVKKRIIFR